MLFAADDVLDAEEGYDDVPDSGHDYADLAAAMGGNEDDSQEDEGADGAEDAGSLGSDEDELGSDEDTDSDQLASDDEHEDDLEMSGDESEEQDDLMLSDGDEADPEADAEEDDINPFELASATDSEEEQHQSGIPLPTFCLFNNFSFWESRDKASLDHWTTQTTAPSVHRLLFVNRKCCLCLQWL